MGTERATTEILRDSLMLFQRINFIGSVMTSENNYLEEGNFGAKQQGRLRVGNHKMLFHPNQQPRWAVLWFG